MPQVMKDMLSHMRPSVPPSVGKGTADEQFDFLPSLLCDCYAANTWAMMSSLHSSRLTQQEAPRQLRTERFVLRHGKGCERAYRDRRRGTPGEGQSDLSALVQLTTSVPLEERGAARAIQYSKIYILAQLTHTSSLFPPNHHTSPRLRANIPASFDSSFTQTLPASQGEHCLILHPRYLV